MATKKSARKPYNKSTGRRYGPGTTDHFHNNKPSAKKRRAETKRARRAVITALAKKVGRKKAEQMAKGKDVDHVRALSKGGSSKPSNLKLVDRSKNRAKDRPTGKRARFNGKKR